MPEKGIFCGINKAADAANMSDLEKKHVPVIECPDTVTVGQPFQVKVKIGELPHVTEEGHFIQWVELKFGENLYARAELTPVFSRPEITFTLVKGGKHSERTMRVIERCNLHGLWESTKTIKITG